MRVISGITVNQHPTMQCSDILVIYQEKSDVVVKTTHNKLIYQCGKESAACNLALQLQTDFACYMYQLRQL